MIEGTVDKVTQAEYKLQGLCMYCGEPDYIKPGTHYCWDCWVSGWIKEEIPNDR